VGADLVALQRHQIRTHTFLAPESATPVLHLVPGALRRCRARTFKTGTGALGSVLGVSGPRTEPGVEPAEAGGGSPETAGRSVVVRARPVRDGVGLGLAVGVSGVAFGAAAVSSGLSTWQACALSLLAFTGASQFALAAVIASGGSLLAGTAGAILLGSRNTLYGLRLADLLRVRGPLRLLAALGVIDETTAITLAQPDPAAARTGFTATFCTLYLTWNLATLGGAIGAGRLGSPDAFGLDVVGPAAFLALIWPRLRAGRTERQVALGGAALAVGTTTVLPVGVPVILAATVALAGALAGPAASSAPASHSESSPGSAP
jgi:predicted branched-subunit amino acid permease